MPSHPSAPHSQREQATFQSDSSYAHDATAAVVVPIHVQLGSAVAIGCLVVSFKLPSCSRLSAEMSLARFGRTDSVQLHMSPR